MSYSDRGSDDWEDDGPLPAAPGHYDPNGVLHPLPDWASGEILSGNVDDWEHCIYALRLRALALEHAVCAHDEVMVNRNPAMSSDYEVRSPAAGIHFQPVQRPGDENEAIRRATDAYIVAGLSHQVHGEAGWAFQDGAFPSLEVFVSCLTDLESDDSDSDDDDDDSDCSGADGGATWTAYGQ